MFFLLRIVFLLAFITNFLKLCDSVRFFQGKIPITFFSTLGGCILLFSKDTDFVPVLEAAWEKGFEVFIANIKENLNLSP
ncbi:hypothetical protein MM0360_09750 [Helicobacter pylori]